MKCATCARALDLSREHRVIVDPPVQRLPEPDYCRWCARPMSERAQALAPLEGYRRFAQAIAGMRRPAVTGHTKAPA